jgi:WD40 repeat protein
MRRLVLVSCALAGCAQPVAKQAAPGSAAAEAEAEAPGVATQRPGVASPIDAQPVIDGSLLILGDPRMRGYSYGAIALNADRSRIAITEGSAIRVWELPARTLAFAVPVGGSSPQFVGDYIGVLPRGGSALRWWDSKGREVVAPYPECTWQVATSSIPPGATQPSAVACAATSPPRVRVFGATPQTLAFDDLPHREDSIDAIAISPDATWLAASTGYRVYMFELATGRRAWVHEYGARDCIAFDRNGYLILGNSDPQRTQTTLVVVNASDGTEASRRPLDGFIETCDVSPASDAMLVIDRASYTTRVFALPTLEPRDVLPAALPQRTAAFSADGRSIYAQNNDHVLEWDRDAKRWAPVAGHLGDTPALALSPDGATVATVGDDGKLLLWPLDGSAPRTLREGLDFAFTAVAFSLDGKRVAIGSAADSFPDLRGPPDGKSVVEVWDVSSGKRVFRVKRSTESIDRLGFTRNGRLFVLDSGAVLAALDAKTGALRSKRELYPGFGSIAGYVEVSDSELDPQATQVMAWLSAGKDFAFVLQTVGGKELYETDGYPDDPRPHAAGFSADGQSWSCVGQDCVPKDARGAALSVIPVFEVYQQDGATSIAPSRTKRGGVLQWHTGTRCRAFHPDGKRYISCSPDGLVRVWDLTSLSGS